MKIAGYFKTSLIEWPGRISSVIFVPGCNLRCPFCYNAHLVDLGKIRQLRLIPEREIFKDLRKRKKFIEGVVVTGGEPTLQTDLTRFLDKCKKMGFLTMIETNGLKPEVIAKLLACNLVDYMAIDFKVPFENYPKLLRPKNLKVFFKNDIPNLKTSLELIFKSGIDFEIRTTVVPGIHSKEVLVKMANQLQEVAKLANHQIANLKWYLKNFQPKNCLNPKFNKIKPYDKMKMEGFLRAVKKIIPETKLRP